MNPTDRTSGLQPALIRLLDCFGWMTAALLLAGCASGPIELDRDPTPIKVGEVVAQDSDAPDPASTNALTTDKIGAEVLWGGSILNVENLSDSTMLEVMAYPLDRRQRPMIGRPAEGRLLVISAGYLESVDYAPGRLLTVLGEISGVTTGTIGDAQYRYPTVEATELHLWDIADEPLRPRFTFGIGINLGN